MELNINAVIKGPRISDKAHAANKKLNQLVLEVHPQANKPAIKKAVETLFDVKVDRVGTHCLKKKKSKGLGRSRYSTATACKKIKIAYVSLAEGYELSLFEQATMPTAEKNEE